MDTPSVNYDKMFMRLSRVGHDLENLNLWDGKGRYVRVFIPPNAPHNAYLQPMGISVFTSERGAAVASLARYEATDINRRDVAYNKEVTSTAQGQPLYKITNGQFSGNVNDISVIQGPSSSFTVDLGTDYGIIDIRYVGQQSNLFFPAPGTDSERHHSFQFQILNRNGLVRWTSPVYSQSTWSIGNQDWVQ